MFELKMQQEKMVDFDKGIWEKGEIVDLYYYTLQEAALMAYDMMEHDYTFISITYKED